MLQLHKHNHKVLRVQVVTCRRDVIKQMAIIEHCLIFTGTSVWLEPFIAALLEWQYTHIFKSIRQATISYCQDVRKMWSVITIQISEGSLKWCCLWTQKMFQSKFRVLENALVVDGILLILKQSTLKELQSKQQHSVQLCRACDCNYSLQMAHFIKSNQANKPSLKTVED